MGGEGRSLVMNGGRGIGVFLNFRVASETHVAKDAKGIDKEKM